MSDQQPDREWREMRRQERDERHGHVWRPGGSWLVGIILIGLGAIFLAQNFGYPIPHNWWALFLLLPEEFDFVEPKHDVPVKHQLRFCAQDCGSEPTAVMPSINKINEEIAKLADGRTIRYLNINDKLADNDGKLFGGMTTDRLHLSERGYQAWADALKPLLKELLGPPSKGDLAPPPTGDPSAKK